MAMRFEIMEMIFHKQQSWLMPLQAEPAKHIELRPFNIHRHEIDRRIARFSQNGIQRHHLDHLSSHVSSSRIDKVFDQSRMTATFSREEWHFGRSARSAARHLEYLRARTCLPQPLEMPLFTAESCGHS